MWLVLATRHFPHASQYKSCSHAQFPRLPLLWFKFLGLSWSPHFPPLGLDTDLSFQPRGLHVPETALLPGLSLPIPGLPIPALAGLGWEIINFSCSCHSSPSSPAEVCPAHPGSDKPHSGRQAPQACCCYRCMRGKLNKILQPPTVGSGGRGMDLSKEPGSRLSLAVGTVGLYKSANTDAKQAARGQLGFWLTDFIYHLQKRLTACKL